MATNNTSILSDGYYNAILWKWMYGKTLTTQEKKVLAGLYRQYPEQMQQLEAERSGGSSGRGQSRNSRAYNIRPGLNNYLERTSSPYSNNGRPVSPGGFQKSGLDEDSTARASGRMTDQSAANTNVHFFTDGTASIGDGRKRTKAEVQRLISRGASGASMSPEDQMIYDRYVQLRSELQQQAAREQMARQQRREMAAFKDKNGIPQDAVLTQEDYDAIRTGKARWGRSLRDINEGVTDNYGVFTREEDAKERAALRNERESARKTNLEEKAKARAARLKEASDLVKSGQAEYTANQKEKIIRLQDERDAILDDKNMSDKDKEIAANKIDENIFNIRSNPREKIVPEKTLKERFNEETIVEDGIRYSANKNGSWGVVHDPSADNARISAEQRRLDNEKKLEKRRLEQLEQNRRDKRDKFITDEARNIMNNSKLEEIPYEDAIKQATERYNLRYGGTTDEDGVSGTTGENGASGANTVRGVSWKDLAARRGISVQSTQPQTSQQAEMPEAENTSFVQDQEAASELYAEANGGTTEAIGDQQPVEQNPSVQLCPRCGKQLDESGCCPSCGYPFPEDGEVQPNVTDAI